MNNRIYFYFFLKWHQKTEWYQKLQKGGQMDIGPFALWWRG